MQSVRRLSNIFSANDVTALVLAGGLGSRLRPSIGHSTPKILAEVREKPFLHHLIHQLKSMGIHRIVLSLGHLAAEVESELVRTDFGVRISTITEKKPLGTGGATAFCLSAVDTEVVLVCNGDTLASFDLSAGLVALNSGNEMASYFYRQEGGGSSWHLASDGADESELPETYAGFSLAKRSFLQNTHKPAPPYGFEEVFLQSALVENNLCRLSTTGPFLDYGTPEGFEKVNAQ